MTQLDRDIREQAILCERELWDLVTLIMRKKNRPAMLNDLNNAEITLRRWIAGYEVKP